MVWAGEPLGILGVGLRDGERRFDDDDVELLRAFASLAALALRNAESFEASLRRAQLERGFSRVASLLAESLSLAETYDAAAQAAADALGADFATVLGPTPAGSPSPARIGCRTRCARSTSRLRSRPPARHGRCSRRRRSPETSASAPSGSASPIASLLAVPVSEGAGGLLLVCFRAPRAFTGHDLELAQQVAAAAHGALERSRLFEAERAARALAQQLARAAAALASELDPDAVLAATASGGGRPGRRGCGAGLDARRRRARRRRRRRGVDRGGAWRPFSVDGRRRRRRARGPLTDRTRSRVGGRRLRARRPAAGPRARRVPGRPAGGKRRRAAWRPLRLLARAAELARGGDRGA